MIPASALRLCKRWEGFHKVVQLKPQIMVGPYLCPALVPTIGYGTVVSSMDHPAITAPEAERLLNDYLLKDMAKVLTLCPVLAKSDDRLGAVMSFSYNLGIGRLKASTLRRRINEEKWSEAALELGKWVWAGGRRLPGLVGRRADEAALMVNPAA
jgi:lysozyme